MPLMVPLDQAWLPQKSPLPQMVPQNYLVKSLIRAMHSQLAQLATMDDLVLQSINCTYLCNNSLLRSFRQSFCTRSQLSTVCCEWTTSLTYLAISYYPIEARLFDSKLWIIHIAIQLVIYMLLGQCICDISTYLDVL